MAVYINKTMTAMDFYLLLLFYMKKRKMKFFKNIFPEKCWKVAYHQYEILTPYTEFLPGGRTVPSSIIMNLYDSKVLTLPKKSLSTLLNHS